jgi:hypothetical protein
MADPQSLVGQDVSSNEETKTDKSVGSYESPFDTCPSLKSKQSSGPQDEDDVPEEEVYKDQELNIIIDFYNCSIVNDPLHSFLRIPLHVEVFEIYFLLKRKQL